MYNLTPTNRRGSGLSGDSLGDVPDWLKRAVGAAISGSTVSIPTPMGRKSFDLSDPKQVAQLKALLQYGANEAKGIRVTGPGSAPPATGIGEALKPLAIGAGILLGLKLLIG